MSRGPDQSVQSGACPLCLSGVTAANAPADVLPILADHFANDCLVTDFIGPGNT